MSFTVDSESIHARDAEEWSMPVNVIMAQVVTVGTQPVQLGLGAIYRADAPDGRSDGWGLRARVTLLLAKALGHVSVTGLKPRLAGL